MKIFEGYPGKAIGELDKILAILGSLFSIFLAIYATTLLDRPILLTASILAFPAGVTYLLMRRYLSSSTIPSLAQIRASSRFYKMLNIVFFFLFSYSILSIYLNPELYTRPLGYFISIALMIAVVAIEILFLSDHKSHIYFALFKIIFIALSVVFSQLLIFPSIVGSDSWWHWGFTAEILDAGHIIGEESYSKLPMMHLMIGSTMLLTGLSYKMAAMLSVSLIQIVCNTLFIFLLGRFLFSSKVGLLAALLLGVASHHIQFGIFAIPNTAGTILILPVTYLLFKIRRERPTIATSLCLVLIAAVILTHTVVTMCLALLLFAFWAGFELFGRLYGEKIVTPVTLVMVILLVVGMFGYWIYASGHIYSFAKLIGWGFSQELWVKDASPLVGKYIPIIPSWEQQFNNLGVILFIALSLPGFLYMIAKKFGTSYGFAAATGGIIVAALALVPPLVGRNIMTERWTYFSQILLAIPVGLAFFLLVGAFRNRLAKASLLAIGVFMLSFLMIMNPTSNMDNRTFAPNTLTRFGFTESEMQAANTISNVWEGEIGLDHGYGRVFMGPTVKSNVAGVKWIGEQLYTQDFSDRQDLLILIREEIVSHPFQSMVSGTHKLDYDPRELLPDQGFSKIYDCASVAGFINLKGSQ